MKYLAVALTAVALFSTAAVAADVTVVRHKVVAYGDLNLGSQDGIAALHNRIVAAAIEVCTVDSEKHFDNADHCRNTAVTKAIAEVGRNFSSRLASNQ